jgi:hypothetical protein
MNNAKTISNPIANNRPTVVKLPPAMACEMSANPKSMAELMAILGVDMPFIILQS